MTQRNDSDPSKSSTVTHTADTRNPEWDTYAPEGQGKTDEQIRADVHQALLERDGAQASTLSISVEAGVVTLSGGVKSAEEKRKISELVRGVPSVKELREQLQVAD